MLKTRALPIARIYVPVKRRATLDPAKVARIAGSILESGQETPIMVREDGERLVLVGTGSKPAARWARRRSRAI